MTTATSTHHFDHPAVDTAEICSCSAAFFDGHNRQAVKIAHLSATDPAGMPAAVVATLTPGQLLDVVEGRLRLGNTRDEDVALWNAAMDRENGYDQ